VFRLPLRQTEGLIRSIIRLFGLVLSIPDHTTLCRRAETLQVFPRPRSGAEPVHLLLDSTGLKLGGAGEWLVEKHGAKTRRSRRKLHLGVDADTGQIVAAQLTTIYADGSGAKFVFSRNLRRNWLMKSTMLPAPKIPESGICTRALYQT
jgi:hypothetical protein